MGKSLFEQMGGTYKKVGDYLLPDVELPEEKPIGVWNTRHYHYLRKTNRILFRQLVISWKMNDYLANKPADSEWCVLPITNIEAYLGSSSLSKSYILLLSGKVLERKSGTSNVCVARFYLPE